MNKKECKEYKKKRIDKEEDAIKRQCCCLRYIVHCMPKVTFLGRIIRLIICAFDFLNISLYIRQIIKAKYRKSIIDIYVLLMSIAFPILVLILGWQEYFWVFIITIYILLTSLIYLLGVVFLDDVYKQPHSDKRSLLLVIVNYIGFTLYFSILYQYFHAVGEACGRIGRKIISNLEAVYFSFVTSTTLGFGDYKPIPGTPGQILVIIQVCTFLLFIVVFFNHFMNSRKDKNQ